MDKIPERKKIKPENAHFFSGNPYEVLMVASNASVEDIKIARNDFIKKFHPNINQDPLATEITQNINLAYEALVNKDGTRKIPEDKTRKAGKQPNQSHNPVWAQTEPIHPMEDFEDDFYQAIKSPENYSNFFYNPKYKNYHSAIPHLFRTEKASDILFDGFFSSVWKGCNKMWNEDYSKECIEYIQNWKKAGVNLDVHKLLSAEKIQDFLATQAMIKIKTSYGEKNSDDFLKFIKSWKKVGIDLSPVVHTEEARGFLENQAVNVKIKIYGGGSFYRANIKPFQDFVSSWKKAGIDLSYVINSDKAQEYFQDEAQHRLKSYGAIGFRHFVETWMKAGWKPDEKIKSEAKKLGVDL